MTDHYETLQVHPRADNEAIRAAYQRLRERYDPAKLSDAADELQELARRRRDEIERAYTVLNNAALRAAYDDELAERARDGAVQPTVADERTGGDEELDYRPLPPARRQERPKNFNAQPRLARNSVRVAGRRVEPTARLPLWVVPTMLVAAAVFGIVLATLITTVLNQPPQVAQQTGPSILGAASEPTVAPTPNTEEIINRFEGQVIAARQVTKQVPDNPNAWLELGNALYDSVVVVRERIATGDEQLQSVYVERLPRWLEASEAYRKVLELQPANVVARADLAASLCYYGVDVNDQSYVTQGLSEAAQALQTDSEEPRAMLSQGLCFVSANPPQTQQALEQWQKVAALPDVDPGIAFQAQQLIAEYGPQ